MTIIDQLPSSRPLPAARSQVARRQLENVVSGVARSWWRLGRSATLAVGIGLIVAGSATAGVLVAPVPPGFSGINDPNLQACMATKTVCDPQTLSELQTLPWSSPLAPGTVTISRSAAESLVRNAIHASGTAPVFSAMMSGASAVRLFGVQRNTNTNESRPVWIVTVVSPVRTDGGLAIGPVTMNYYSAVVDAGSGQITDDCIGCDFLTASE
jgi:hypothetical protein